MLTVQKSLFGVTLQRGGGAQPPALITLDAAEIVWLQAALLDVELTAPNAPTDKPPVRVIDAYDLGY
jgi:hypothetical protein